MVQEPTEKRLLALLFLFVFSLSAFIPTVFAWGNGCYSAGPLNPDYGTHDWIAQHAKNWLPAVEQKWIDDNLNYFLYGTEYPDNSGASYGTTSGYGDTTKHHNYYNSSGSVTDASVANRAKVEYDKALAELKAGRNVTAAIYAGSMSHYIDDIAVFGHAMNNETHHSSYEDYVGTRTSSYSYGVFESYLAFDGNLENVSAYDASISLGCNTFNDGGGTYTANWMDTHYDWSNSAFKNRRGESLNLATNYVADVLHTLYICSARSESSAVSFAVTPIEFPINFGGIAYKVHITTNSTVSSLVFNQTLKQISFNVTGLSGTSGYCNVTVPLSLLGGPFIVLLDGIAYTCTSTHNSTHSFISFNYSHSTHTAQIIGAAVIPELPTIFANMLALAVLAVALIFTKRKLMEFENKRALFSFLRDMRDIRDTVKQGRKQWNKNRR